MNTNIFNVKIITQIISVYYQKLIDLSLVNLEETDEYHNILLKIKDLIQKENELYQALSSTDLIFLTNYFNRFEIENENDSRIYSRSNDQNRLRDKNNIIIDNKVLLSSIISSKIIIDVLKKVTKKIEDVQDEEDNIMLTAYNNVHKYKFLTANSFIEQIALNCQFDIEQMPVINFYQIDEELNIGITKYAKNEFIKYIKLAIDELIRLVSNDKHLYMYVTMFEYSRIEVMIEYLNKPELNKIKNYIENNFNNINNVNITNLKKLIKQKEKDLGI